MKGFGPTLCHIVHNFPEGRTVCVDICHCFQTLKGLRQGGLISSIMYNIHALHSYYKSK